MRRWEAKLLGDNSKKILIDEDEVAGFFLYVYDNDKCTYDGLQDTFEFAVEVANEKFGVERSSWIQVDG
jgi:hypothetical protein